MSQALAAVSNRPVKIDCDLIKLFEYMHAKDVKNVSLFNPVGKNDLNPGKYTLSNIERMLKMGFYINNYWKLVEDIYKSFQFIYKHFTIRTQIHQLAVECEQIFNDEMTKFMRNKGYCCGIWYVMSARKLDCSSNRRCTVESGYYRLNCWVYCERCFKKLPENNIKLDNEVCVNKSQFTYGIFIEKETEEFVKCKKCKRLFHERCVLYIKSTGLQYVCNLCRNSLPTSIKFSSELIPSSECDRHIEQFLRKNNIQNAENLVIRMVSNVTTKFKPKNIITNYRNDNFNDGITYNNCVIFTFLKTSDADICFFGIYFQLYGDSKCPDANKNSVYLSYIDSVKLCRISNRTKIFQYILLGLFDYLKERNFSKVFIWSCPPKKSVDYIFNRKPPDMKIITKSRLINWYQKLMKIAYDEKIIKHFSGIKEYASKQNWDDLNNIPYFDADMWPIRLEEAIVAAEATAKKSNKNNVQMSEILSLMKIQIIGFDDQYFVLHLKDTDGEMKPVMPATINGHFIKNRNELVDMFWEYKLEYSNERHAKFSTANLICSILLDTSCCIKCKKNDYLSNNFLCISCSNLLSSNHTPNTNVKRRSSVTNLEDQPSTSRCRTEKADIYIVGIEYGVKDYIDLTSDDGRIRNLLEYETIDLCD